MAEAEAVGSRQEAGLGEVAVCVDQREEQAVAVSVSSWRIASADVGVSHSIRYLACVLVQHAVDVQHVQ